MSSRLACPVAGLVYILRVSTIGATISFVAEIDFGVEIARQWNR